MKGKQAGRFWHYVKPNENNETLQQCIFVDTETDEIKVDEEYSGHKLRFGWTAYTRRNAQGAWTKPKWKRFTHFEEFWLWAMSHTRVKVRTWIWCHNSNFDYPVLSAFSYLPDIGWELESAIIDAPPTVVTYRCGRKTLVLADTLNIWREPLKKLGERIGLEKLTRPEAWGSEENDDYYCRRDVEIILKSVTGWADFLVSNDMGGFAPTIAAQSMRSFRHRWLRSKILIDNNHTALDLARNCYHGGRCEAGFIGTRKGPIHYLDVNSMYPFAMSYAEMPVRLKGLSYWARVSSLPALLKQYCLCAHVRLRTEKPFAALVHNDKLVFPVGTFDCYLSTPEIEYALEHATIEEVYLVASYDKEVAFREFALDLYRYKEEASRDGRDVEARHWKLLLNSFYGKWGQNGRKWIKVASCDRKEFLRVRDIDAQTGKQSIRRHFGGHVLERSEESECSASHPAIAAHICAQARMILWALIEKVPPTEYLYCDTDSLLVTADGLDKLRDRLDQTKLGYLKQVKVIQDLTIYGCKDLILDGQATLKGIRKAASQLGPNTYRQVKWHGLGGLLAAGSIDMPLTSIVVKTLRRTYDKGTVLPSGQVVPLHFPLEGS